MNNGILGVESKQFGPFLLEWDANMDGFHWTLRDVQYEKDAILKGFVKYVGWNRWTIERSADSQTIGYLPFECYAHNWEHFKKAMDYVYYTLGRKAAEGTGYEGDFQSPMRKALS